MNTCSLVWPQKSVCHLINFWVHTREQFTFIYNFTAMLLKLIVKIVHTRSDSLLNLALLWASKLPTPVGGHFQSLRRFHFHSSWFTKSIYIIVSVCLSIYMYDSLRNTVIKKNLCETQLRFEGQQSALICAQNFHCWTFLSRIKKVSN